MLFCGWRELRALRTVGWAQILAASPGEPLLYLVGDGDSDLVLSFQKSGAGETTCSFVLPASCDVGVVQFHILRHLGFFALGRQFGFLKRGLWFAGPVPRIPTVMLGKTLGAARWR